MYMDKLIIPPYLHEGDKVVILSPSGKIDKSFLKGAVKRLASWGLQPVLSRHAGSSNGVYAGTVSQRLEDLQEAMDDPLHAPMARHLTVEPEDDFCTQALRDILTGAAATPEGSFSYTCDAHKLNRRGTAEGILRGGNFAVFNGLRGTPYDIPTDGTVLFIEDVGERPHAIERMMYNLKLGGVLERLSGLVIGQFTEYEEKKQLGKELYGALADLVKEYDYPVCFNFPVGHVTMNLPLVCGAPVQLDVDKKGVRLTFQL